jgi:putative ABC transport system permease protein
MAARLARREVRRHPGRSALVTALVALPVAGMLLAVVYQRTNELSAAETWRRLYGQADAVLDLQPPRPVPELPAGSRSVDVVKSFRVLVAETGGCSCEITELPDEPLTDGMVQVLGGRAPRAVDEVLLSPEASAALGVEHGERLELARPVPVEATVVGIGYVGPWSDQATVVLGPGSGLTDDALGGTVRLVDLPGDLTPAELAVWEATAGPHQFSPGHLATLRPWTGSDDHDDEVRVIWVLGATGMTVLGVVIAAAFAAGARRQLITLGQLAANGAAPAVLRRVLFLQGTVTGLIGSAAGLALGAVILLGFRPLLQDLAGQALEAWDVRLPDVLPIVAIAVAVATVAATVPAFGASRVSVLTALAGRRPLGRVSRRRTAAGLLVTGAGLGCLATVAWASRDGLANGSAGPLSALALVGPVLLLLGVCTAAPAYVAVLRPLASATRGPWRLAARSLLRSRTRTSALVAAIGAVAAIAVAAASLGLRAEGDARDRALLERVADDVVVVRSDHYLADTVLAVPDTGALVGPARRAEQVVPEAERTTLSAAAVPGADVLPDVVVRGLDPADGAVDDGGRGSWPAQPMIADDELRRVFDLDETVEQALDRHGAVLFGEEKGHATVEAVTYEPPTDPLVQAGSIAPATQSTVTFDAPVLDGDHTIGSGVYGQVLLTPDLAGELGFVPVPVELALRSPEPLTAAQRDDLAQVALASEAATDEALASSTPGGPNPVRVWVHYHEPSFWAGPGFVEAVSSGTVLLFALFVVAAGLALAAAETRDERAALAVLGAPPRMLRRTSAYKAFLLTLLGGALAVPVGLAPVAVWSRLGVDPRSIIVPWRTIAVLVIAVPVATAFATALAGRVAALERSGGRIAPPPAAIDLSPG